MSDSDARAPAPRTRVGGKLKACGSKSIFERRLILQLGGEDRKVGIGRRRHDDELDVARLQVDGLSADEDYSVQVRSERLECIQQH